MCGIVGYTGLQREAQEVLQSGLHCLEYRGYDSAGVAVWDGATLHVRRAVGKLANLDALLAKGPLSGRTGIGHTRWATHGKPTEKNAHPHQVGKVVLVHNGIVENIRELRTELRAEGREAQSDTDTELVAQLIDRELSAGADPLGAVRAAAARLVGSYAFAALCSDFPDLIVVAKNGGSPLVLGPGENEAFLASDIAAILPYTRGLLFLEDGEFAVLSPQGVEIVDGQGRLKNREPRTVQWDPVSAEKGGYDHFMLKEIFEQPRAIRDTIGNRLREDQLDIDFGDIDLSPARAKALERVTLAACGSSYYACQVGKYLVEEFAGLHADVDLASEFRYRSPVLGQNCLVIPVSQSGETADTLAALREAKTHGARVLSICNTRDSTIARESHDVLYTVAGPEIGVASTKGFTTQFTALYLLALKLGIARGMLDEARIRRAQSDLRRLPRMVEQALAQSAQIETVARRYFRASNFLFLGRGVMYPIAREGALKLKEIAYIHAEGTAAGEIKHGLIALVDENVPVVVIANQSSVYEKVLSNLEEVRARDGRIIAIAGMDDAAIEERVDAVIRIPEMSGPLSALLATIPVQLLAYHVAALKGTDIDQPRNLAKSVTVE